MRALLVLCLIPCLVSCGAEGDETSRAVSASESVPAGRPTLRGYESGLLEARRGRLVSLGAHPSVRAAFSSADLATLRAPDSVTLYVPGPDDDETRLANDEMLLMADIELKRAVVVDPSDQEALALAVLDAVAGSDGSGARCFNPHHAVRFSRGDSVVELAFCLGCRRFAVDGSAHGQDGHGTIDGTLGPTLEALCAKYGLGGDTGGC